MTSKIVSKTACDERENCPESHLPMTFTHLADFYTIVRWTLEKIDQSQGRKGGFQVQHLQIWKVNS
jgi:hypothetical protein